MNMVMFQQLRFLFLFVALFLIGCAAPVKKFTIEKPQESLLREKALEYERQGKLRIALQLWESLTYFVPEDQESRKKIAELKEKIREKVDHHLTRGRTYYVHSSIRDARKEFLHVLFYDPDNLEALDYVKNKIHGEDYLIHDIKPGETFQELARLYYQDPQKDFIIARYNDMTPEAALVQGKKVKIPVIVVSAPDPPSYAGTGKNVTPGTLPKKDPSVKSPEEPQVLTAMITDYDKGLKSGRSLSDAKQLMDKKRYIEAISIAEEILEQDDENQRAKNIINESNYQMGKGFADGKNYREAIKYFSRVDPEYQDVGRLKNEVEMRLAEIHYNEGVRYFVNEKLEKAIEEWKMTLAFNPGHQKARADIENAGNILKKLKEIK
jgi:tetratricopeptide (TPR) repeat protein